VHHQPHPWQPNRQAGSQAHAGNAIKASCASRGAAHGHAVCGSCSSRVRMKSQDSHDASCCHAVCRPIRSSSCALFMVDLTSVGSRSSASGRGRPAGGPPPELGEQPHAASALGLDPDPGAQPPTLTLRLAGSASLVILRRRVAAYSLLVMPWAANASASCRLYAARQPTRGRQEEGKGICMACAGAAGGGGEGQGACKWALSPDIPHVNTCSTQVQKHT
jgi:hypothetical protein